MRGEEGGEEWAGGGKLMVFVVLFALNPRSS